jgi:hypothetical protein
VVVGQSAPARRPDVTRFIGSRRSFVDVFETSPRQCVRMFALDKFDQLLAHLAA